MIDQDKLSSLLEIVDRAAELLRNNKNKKLQVFYKDDGSECTNVDLLSDDLIYSYLEKNFPNIPIISEERVSDTSHEQLAKYEYVWVIDPLDGTSAYIKGGVSYTINIALLFNQEPIFGLINAPEDKVTYYSYKGRLLKKIADKISEVKKDQYTEDIVRVVISRRSDPETINRYLLSSDKYEIKAVGGAKKFLKLASGEYDIFPRYTPTCEWDIAAGDAILRACGGGIYDSSGNRVKYLKKNFANGALFATRNNKYLKFFSFG